VECRNRPRRDLQNCSEICNKTLILHCPVKLSLSSSISQSTPKKLAGVHRLIAGGEFPGDHGVALELRLASRTMCIEGIEQWGPEQCESTDSLSQVIAGFLSIEIISVANHRHRSVC
jgi:hypothetical protein